MPDEAALSITLGETYPLWTTIESIAAEMRPEVRGEWKHGGSFGWSYRILYRKRILLYLLPREGYFKVAFVLGDRAFAAVMESSVGQDIKWELARARRYAEGRGIRIEIRQRENVADIQKLLEFKLYP